MTNAVTIPADAPGGKRAYVARITGRDPQTKFAREFTSFAVTQPGLYEASTRKGGKQWFAVVRADDGQLVRSIHLLDETVAQLVDGFLDRMEAVRPYRDQDGDWMIRRDGVVCVRTARDELVAERARLVARLAEVDAQLSA